MADRNPRVLILTEAGRSRGDGHVARCSGLKEAFLQSGYQVEMWVDSDQPCAEKTIAGTSFSFGDWQNGLDCVLPAKGLASLITVVDSYEADRGLLDAIASRSGTCCFFDDTARLVYPQGTLVNAAINADSLYGRRMEGIRYLLGPQYAVLRKELWEKKPYLIRDRIESVMVALGTGVSWQQALEVARTVRDSLPASAVTILHRAARDQAGMREGPHWVWGLGPEEFVALALHSDMAVCSGGQTLLELACLGVPAVTILTADNQQANAAGFERAGFSIQAGSLKDPGCRGRLESILKAYSPIAERARRSAQGRTLVDGLGAFHVIRALEEEPAVRKEYP